MRTHGYELETTEEQNAEHTEQMGNEPIVENREGEDRNIEISTEKEETKITEIEEGYIVSSSMKSITEKIDFEISKIELDIEKMQELIPIKKKELRKLQRIKKTIL